MKMRVCVCLKCIGIRSSFIVANTYSSIAGQERFGNMTRVYYKEAAGAIVVFDVTRAATFDGALKWKADLDQKLALLDGRPIPALLIANKVRVYNSAIGDVQCDHSAMLTIQRGRKVNLNVRVNSTAS
jgi:hypothetical protein